MADPTTTKDQLADALGDVRGLGDAKRRALLDRFGSLDAIAHASVDELQEVRGIGEAVALAIRDTAGGAIAR
ncbi:MAG TPA: helix-hairpin-helix domain-containing protein, partial [Nitriliruptorales bacterium]